MKHEQHLHGEWTKDPLYELWVQAWMAYHRAADAVDGHLPIGDRSLVNQAVKAGHYAMDRVLREVSTNKPTAFDVEATKEWNRAKLEALRRIEKRYYE